MKATKENKDMNKQPWLCPVKLLSRADVRQGVELWLHRSESSLASAVVRLEGTGACPCVLPDSLGVEPHNASAVWQS